SSPREPDTSSVEAFVRSMVPVTVLPVADVNKPAPLMAFWIAVTTWENVGEPEILIGTVLVTVVPFLSNSKTLGRFDPSLIVKYSPSAIAAAPPAGITIREAAFKFAAPMVLKGFAAVPSCCATGVVVVLSTKIVLPASNQKLNEPPATLSESPSNNVAVA